jgi:hypothetical protein
MTQKKIAIYIPALIAVLTGLLLAAYTIFLQPHGVDGDHPMPPEGINSADFQPKEGGGELFKNMGTIAIICGAVSFTWLLLKRKLASPSQIVKQLSRWALKVHTWFGWAALILVLVHGGYFLITKFQDHKTLSGLASFAVLLALGGYGWTIRRFKRESKTLRFTHRLLSFVWIPVLLLHAGGSVIGTAAGTVGSWVLIWLIERAASRQQVSENAG